MPYVVVGCSHRTAPLSVRERLAVAQDEMDTELAALGRLEAVDECLLLSTCNRVEVYASSDAPSDAQQQIATHLVTRSGIDADQFASHGYSYADVDAVHHIFRVTASLDAMVVGEAQILGQVRRAYEVARACSAMGRRLDSCMQIAFLAAKKVRNQTDVAKHAVSASSAAVEIAGRILGPPASLRVAVVGSGEMAELAVRHLIRQGTQSIHLLNRTVEKAEQMAEQFGAVALPFEQLELQLRWADVVITSTAARRPLVERERLVEIMRMRRQRALLLVDIAVPRNVDAECRRVSNVYVYNMDDLQEIVEANLATRRAEARSAERLVRAETDDFIGRIAQEASVPLVRQLRERMLAIAEGEADRAARRLGLTESAQRAEMHKMAHRIANKLLHTPTMRLKTHGRTAGGSDLTAAARTLFDLDDAAGESEDDPGVEPNVSPMIARPAPVRSE